MLVIGSGLGGSVVALQLTKKRYRTGLLAVREEVARRTLRRSSLGYQTIRVGTFGAQGHTAYLVAAQSRDPRRVRCRRLLACTAADTELSVVNQLRLHGVDGLRIASGPVTPIAPSSSTMATAYTIGEHARRSRSAREHRRSGRPFCKSLLARHSQQAEPISAAVVGGTRISEEGNAAVHSGFLGRRGTKQPK